MASSRRISKLGGEETYKHGFGFRWEDMREDII
jgi:hypothetical protein